MAALTLDYIKHATGEFDAETIFQALLSNRSFQRIEIGSVDKCCNLRLLDLSHNSIIRMENLEGLAQLVSLDLSFNKIPKVQELDGMPNLERLKLKSNPIARLVDLDGLRTGPKLRHLHLQNIDKTDFCPVCFQPDYQRKVLELCPGLTALDSRRRNLPDLEAEVGKLDKPIDLDLPEPQTWFTAQDLELGDTQSEEAVAKILQPHADDFQAALADMQKSLQEATELLKAPESVARNDELSHERGGQSEDSAQLP
jgi:hypothetical protein